MRAFIIVFSVILFFSCKEEKIQSVTMQDDVSFLASDSLNGRQTGTEGELAAAAYIEKRLKAIGLQPKGVAASYTQTFSFKPSSNPHEQAEYTNETLEGMITGTNVIGYLDNNAEHTVVIGAHYDHLGTGGEGSLYREEGDAIHNGADDNASGVAIMLQLAERLRQLPAPKNNYLFIAFSGEEMGLLGSNYFVKNPTVDAKKINYMINLDMVGRLNEEKTLAAYGVGTSPIFKQTLFANNTFDLNIAENDSGIGPSDHTSFYLADIPVLFFFTGQHSDYHKPTDDTEKLNFDGMETITSYIESIVKDLDGAGKLAFRKTKNESEEVPAFKVALGVVPDYLFTGEGMRIDGISEDKPAQKAGLQKGDVVIKLGDKETKDMMSYMKALATFEEGQTIEVTVNRSGEIITFEVTF
ncbi:M20/M25/M40 family metallo-hydrolase [Patiriisocius hiemis]|uniref:M20/M25/M40 family metallo-hydrolase n=1 Tax=Patiriisocius hiemis TaxID=3075604 RepID=A0ABU2YGW7_9FLAO|nr:M20/M25/M40 family metallo-hydrolase [Constantimarinum sp. W242]MDT0556303.1 M20/M25/M40 family metallo-hydrolase [Constantimarinum sp. W242]